MHKILERITLHYKCEGIVGIHLCYLPYEMGYMKGKEYMKLLKRKSRNNVTQDKANNVWAYIAERH